MFNVEKNGGDLSVLAETNAQSGVACTPEWKETMQDFFNTFILSTLENNKDGFYEIYDELVDELSKQSTNTEPKIANVFFTLPSKEKADAFSARLVELGYTVNSDENDIKFEGEITWGEGFEPQEDDQEVTDMEWVIIECTLSEMQDDVFREKLDVLVQEFDGDCDGDGYSTLPYPHTREEKEYVIELMKPYIERA